MTTQTFGMQHLIRSVLFAAIVAVLVVTSIQRAEANQSGPGVNDPAQFQKALCEAAGGVGTIEVFRTVGSGLTDVQVNCKGGLLDGLRCDNHTDPVLGTICAFLAPPPSGSQGTRPTTGVNEVPADQVLTPIDEVADPASTEQPSVNQPVTGDVTADPGTATDPIVSDEPGTVIDQPVVADDSVDPVITGEPIIEPAPTVSPLVPVNPTQYDQPILIGQ
jgi:hypothetical protein